MAVNLEAINERENQAQRERREPAVFRTAATEDNAERRFAAFAPKENAS